MRTFILALCALATLTLVSCQSDPTAPSNDRQPLAKTVIRPLSDFLDAQGTYCIVDGDECSKWWAPVDNYFGWANIPAGRFALVDYAGVAERWLRATTGGTFGTTHSGSVKETELKDGTVEVSVDLHTYNAMAFATVTDGNTYGDVLFGATPAQILAGATPALVDCHLKIDFVLPEKGAPIPDVIAWLNGDAGDANITSLSFEASGPGPLRTAFGVPDGTSGRIHVSQVGQLASHSKSKNFDGFPVENILLTVTGR